MSKKILIVDDDPRIREVYSQALETQGFEVKTEPDGERALDAIKAEKPDLVLLDIMMPNIHGLQILDIIKATPEAKDLKVVILTALSDENTKDQAKKLGAAGFLVKSETTMEDAIQAVSNILGN